MKKMFISVIALAMSMMAMATETAYVEIKLTGETGGANSIYLFEDDAYTNAYESGADVEKIMSQSNNKSVLLYGFVGSTPCEDVVAANLDGLVLGFATNQVDQNYTLHFIDYEGKTLTLYDRVTNTSTVITDGGSYPFSVDASLVGRHQINDRFYINIDPASLKTVTTNAYGFCSFASATAVTLPAGLKAYKGAFEESDFSLTLSYIGQVVPANTGVILWTPEEISKEFAYTEGGSAAAVSGNDFVGAVAAKPVSEIVATAIYCLHGNELMKYVGTEDIPAGKAYLPVTVSGPNPAPKHIVMRFNGATAVENVEAGAEAVKFVEDGQILIRRGNEVYNLQGQIVK
jgi:hypothetical protein